MPGRYVSYFMEKVQANIISAVITPHGALHFCGIKPLSVSTVPHTFWMLMINVLDESMKESPEFANPGFDWWICIALLFSLQCIFSVSGTFGQSVTVFELNVSVLIPCLDHKLLEGWDISYFSSLPLLSNAPSRPEGFSAVVPAFYPCYIVDISKVLAPHHMGMPWCSHQGNVHLIFWPTARSLWVFTKSEFNSVCLQAQIIYSSRNSRYVLRSLPNIPESL